MRRKGFTILEVSIVLAVSTLLFVMIAVGLSARIANSRYETAVRELSAFLSNIYTETLNTENAREESDINREYCTLASAAANQSALESDDNPGRTDCAIYGKVAIFGSIDDKIYVADLIGDVVEYAEQAKEDTEIHGANEEGNTGHGVPLSEVRALTPIAALDRVNADYLAMEKTNDNLCKLSAAGKITSYEPSWGAKLTNGQGEPFVGMVIVARSPATGALVTYTFAQTDEAKVPNLPLPSDLVNCSPTKADYSSLISAGHFWAGNTYETRFDDFKSSESEELGFCVRSEDFYVSGRARYMAFLGAGTNSNAIKIYDDDMSAAKCIKKEGS